MTEQGTETSPATVRQPPAPRARRAAPRPAVALPGPGTGRYHVPHALALAATAERRGWAIRHKTIRKDPEFHYLHVEVGRKLAAAEIVPSMVGDVWLYVVVWQIEAAATEDDRRRNRPLIDRGQSSALTPYYPIKIQLPSLRAVMDTIDSNPRPGFQPPANPLKEKNQ